MTERLVYLDNRRSFADVCDSPAAVLRWLLVVTAQRGNPTENYYGCARELHFIPQEVLYRTVPCAII